MITEQEAWDEYMKLLDLQEYSVLWQSKGIEKTKIIKRIMVFDFMNRMKEGGFLSFENIQPGFTNWFFDCKGRKFSICRYDSGFLELRLG